MMTSLITSDIHLTDRPRDDYKWGLFPWLSDAAVVDEVLILGDLTDPKDRHSSKLVNRLIDNLAALSDTVNVVLLKGNHDYVDPNNPFFRFINNMPNIVFLVNTEVREISVGKSTFVPAGVKWNFKLHDFPFCFTHTTFRGARVENDREIDGVDPNLLKDYEGMVYSGDVHVPQRLRDNIEYVGSPYHVHFGDSFDPRVLLLRNSGKTTDLFFPAPRKHTISISRDPDELLEEDIAEGDHVKVRCFLRRADYDKWRDIRDEIKKIAADRGWLLAATELRPIASSNTAEKKSTSEVVAPDQLIESYVKRKRADAAYLKIGKELLTE